MTERRRNLYILLLALGLAVVSTVVIFLEPTKLGLDLQGGVQLVYKASPTKDQALTPEALNRAKDTMEKRVNQFGVAEPEITTVGNDQLEVSLPAVSNAERAAAQVGRTAQLFFYDWEGNILDKECKRNPTVVNGGQTPISGLYNAVNQASKCPAFKGRNTTSEGPVFYAFNKKTKKPFNSGIPDESRSDILQSLRPNQRANAVILKVNEGVVVLRDEQSSGSSKLPDRWWILRDNPELRGTELTDPAQTFDQFNRPVVSFNFTDKGRQQFADITKRIAQRGADNALPGVPANAASQHFAIRLDTDLASVPIINFQENPDGISGSGGAQISGNFSVQEAQDLANILKDGALPLKLEQISSSQVSATLGKQALDQGLIAALAGFLVVAGFLIVFYRVLGLIAAGALVIYALYFFAILKLIPVVLTLPGIAGLILTIGVAADANIVIFERIKEEVRAGRSIPAAISTGYKKGFSTIVDANVVALLTAFILFMVATAGVKGFALTLGIGTIVSLFTAVLATHAILLSMSGSPILRSKAALGAKTERIRWRFNFTGASRWFFSISGVILLIGGFAIATKGFNFGIDFVSGTRIEVALKKAATVPQVRDVLAQTGNSDAKVQSVQNKELGRNVFLISTKTLDGPGQGRVTSSLTKNFGIAGDANIRSVGAVYGDTVVKAALIAIIASLLIISLYIAFRFEWKYAVPVLIALTHDILITAGVYSLTGREVTTSTVAALLTILGFSLYDTIIVFDRIRENVPRMPAAAFSQIVNRSMSEVLTRSLVTSLSTLLPVLALLLFGGETLQDFAFALMIGILSGAYSSIFIASPVLTHWKERESAYRARDRRIFAEHGFIPAFAVAVGGQAVDVAPVEKKRRSETSLTAPANPQVSGSEFDEMVKNLGIESSPPASSGPTRPRGGRRARGDAPKSGKDGSVGGSRSADKPSSGGGSSEPSTQGGDSDSGDKPKKPKNRRHGRPR